MQRLLVLASIAGVALYIGCGGGDAAPKATPTIVLPTRDGGSSTEAGAPTCDTQTDPNNCGACGTVCPSGPRGTAACAAGKCVLSCQSGFGDCNESRTDGCETDVTSAVDHCGACGRDCRACGGSSCTTGACDATSFATTTADPTLLVVDAAHITYADTTHVEQLTIADQTAEPIFTVDDTPALATSGNDVLFVEPGSTGAAGIYSVFPGFVGPQIAAYARGESVDTFTIDDTGVYYAFVTENSARSVVRCKSCTVPTVLSANENALREGGIALDATTVFFGAADMIRRVEKTADGLKTLTIGQTPRNLQVDADYIYWINEEANVFGGGGTPGDIARMPKAGGDVTKIVSGLTHPRGLTLVGDSLYAADQGVVFRVAKDGTSRLDLAHAAGAGPIAVDQACVWFADGAEIKKISR